MTIWITGGGAAATPPVCDHTDYLAESEHFATTTKITEMLAFSEDESLHAVRGWRKLHPRLLNSVAFSDTAVLGDNTYIVPLIFQEIFLKFLRAAH